LVFVVAAAAAARRRMNVHGCFSFFYFDFGLYNFNTCIIFFWLLYNSSALVLALGLM